MHAQRSPVEAGWQQLGAGCWDAAAHCFAEALAEHPDDPRALEGSAWAAWWRNDADTLRRDRARTFQEYLALGDHIAAARAAIWLGCDHHEIWGEHAVANGWYQRARRLLADLPTTAEHAWLAFHEGAYAIELADDATTALARASEALAVARSLSVHDVVFLALALEGLARVTVGDVEAGMRCLDEAAVAATSGEMRERIAITWTLCYLIYACERVRDFDRTAQWCRQMKRVAAEIGFDAGVGICRVHYGSVLVLHGDWERAESELERSRRVFTSVRPAAVGESDVRLGELRRRQGRTEEAAALFTGALPHPLAQLGLANLALDRGDAAAALADAQEVLGATPPDSLTQVADALAVVAAAAAAAGDNGAARDAADRLVAIADQVGNRPLRAMAAAALGAVADGAGDDAGARRHHERAATLFLRAGMPFEAARAHGAMARALSRQGRTEFARHHAFVAAEQLRALGVAGATDPGDVGRHRRCELTDREVEVLALLAAGLTDRQIADRLYLSEHTVHRHVSNIRTKLGVRSRAAAVAIGVERGVLDHTTAVRSGGA